MKLDWNHNQQNGYISCRLDNIIHYRSYDGGATIEKYAGTSLTKSFVENEWEVEKQWISEHYSDNFGKYEPFSAEADVQQQWHNNNPDWVEAFPAFGTYDGQYLDRLQRPSSVQVGDDLDFLWQDPGQQIKLEWDSETKSIYTRPYCVEQETFYNVQPCCVFPDNPGRTKLDESGIQDLIDNYDLPDHVMLLLK